MIKRIIICFFVSNLIKNSNADHTIGSDILHTITNSTFAEFETNSTDYIQDIIDFAKFNRSSRSLQGFQPVQPGYVTSVANPETYVNTTDIQTDKIMNVQADPTQIIVFTTKNGPHDKLRIRIELTDLTDNRVMPPIDLQGIWLMINRGKYTIPFLKPDRFYGLYFQSDNIVNNRHISHVEERLVKTAPRQGNSSTSLESLFEVKMHRNLDGEVNTEGFYVTARWLDTINRVNGSFLIIDVNVDCLNSKSGEKIRLPHYDDSITVEIRIDHRYDLENLNKTSHQVKAHITPTSCKKICWKKSIEIASAKNRFSQDYGTECRDIEGTTSITYLRNLKHHTVEGDTERELVLNTESAEESEEAFVTIQALRIDTANDSDVIYRSFSTRNTNGMFRIPIENDAVYAVQYEYTKVKPFHYTEREHFLVETPAVNSSRPTRVPVEISFKPSDLKEHEHSESLKPEIVLKRGANYAAHSVHLHLEPFCNHEAKDILLTSEQPSYHLNAAPSLCTSYPDLLFCSSINPTAQSLNVSTSKSCSSPILCYSNAVVLKTGGVTGSGKTGSEGSGTPERYASEIRCLNITQHFIVSSSKNSSYTLMMISLILLRYMYGFIY